MDCGFNNLRVQNSSLLYFTWKISFHEGQKVSNAASVDDCWLAVQLSVKLSKAGGASSATVKPLLATNNSLKPPSNAQRRFS